MVNWPAILKYAAEDELTFVSSNEQWSQEPDLHGFAYSPADTLIDSTGKVFTLTHQHNGLVTPQESNDVLDLDGVIDLVRKHAAVCGQCCISKISSPDIANAVLLVKDIS